jgi:hypothetical protein
MHPDDVPRILGWLHVESPWTTLDAVAHRVGYPAADIRADLEDLVRERHLCAHEALHGVTAIWLRSIPERVLSLAVAFDLLASVAAGQLRLGTPTFLQETNWLQAQTVELRFVKERRRDAAELIEGRRRASRVATDVDVLFRAAETRCGATEGLVRHSTVGAVVDWAVPVVG